MRILLLCIFLLVPVLAFSYTSIISKPLTASTVLSIAQPKTSQEFFGLLTNYPHTYTFAVTEEFLFKSSVSVQDVESQKNDVSIILVKAERRGVSEIGRTKITEQSWSTQKHILFAESFREGGYLEYTLVPGNYTLEVSSPNNEGKYRLLLGDGKIKRGYFGHLQALFEVKTLLGSSRLSVIFSPLIYVPLMVLLIVCIGLALFLKKTNHTHATGT